MKKNIFAVCDLEVDYAFNFMDYLNQKKNLPFEIQAFTTAESLLAYGKENHIELLLISDKAMRKELLGLTDLHNLIACRHECFYFRAGIQLGISLGSIAVLSDDMPD